MNKSLQEILLYIPFHQLTFVTRLPKETVYYEAITNYLTNQELDRPTLILLQHFNEWEKINDKEFIINLIQNPFFVGLVINSPTTVTLDEEVCSLFEQCQLPIVQLHDSSFLSLFKHEHVPYPYTNMSAELNSFIEKGFIPIATNLSKAIDTPFLYLDSQFQLVWQTGKAGEVQEANRWLNVHQRELVRGAHIILTNSGSKENSTEETSFEAYEINIAGISKQMLLASRNLVDWQKRMIDKLVGLTALLLQTEEIFQGQEEKFKEHFLYDLLFHKFESEATMVKQAKMWGWNLERPHHLLVVNTQLPDDLQVIDWQEEIIQCLEEEEANLTKIIPSLITILYIVLEGKECRFITYFDEEFWISSQNAIKP